MAEEKKNITITDAGKKVQAGQGRQLPPIKIQVRTPPVKTPKKPKKSR